ncbi:MAG: hypothetical protein HC862_18560 [Scytonema sp. RU_4_4]|nr:hypothetical protein [Scytonema sp. RU_4_4]NJR75357.1 hypothetical protein [Scytonema sp. CRU_2_7]
MTGVATLPNGCAPYAYGTNRAMGSTGSRSRPKGTPQGMRLQRFVRQRSYPTEGERHI